MFKNTWKMYEMMCKMGKGGFKQLRFNLGWSQRKTKRHLKKLINAKIVKVQDGCKICGIKKEVYYPTPVKELINWDEMTSAGRYIPLKEKREDEMNNVSK